MLKIVYPTCCGMDVHKSFIVACIASTNEKGVTTYQSKRFSTFTGDLRRCAAWLAEHNRKDVCMESTGKYWIPVYNILDQHVKSFWHILNMSKRFTERKPIRRRQNGWRNFRLRRNPSIDAHFTPSTSKSYVSKLKGHLPDIRLYFKCLSHTHYLALSYFIFITHGIL